MSATNSRIAKLRRAKKGLEEDYAAHKATWTVQEKANWTTAMNAIERLIGAEKLRLAA